MPRITIEYQAVFRDEKGQIIHASPLYAAYELAAIYATVIAHSPRQTQESK